MGYYKKAQNNFLTILFVLILAIVPYFEFVKITHPIIEDYEETNTLQQPEKYIKYIKNDITVKSVFDSLDTPQSNISINIYDKNYKTKDSDIKTASGDIIEILYNKEVKGKYTISIIGDSNGDGVLNTLDLTQMRKHIAGWVDPNTGKKYQKSGAYYYALDFNKDGKINTQDLVIIRKIIAGIPIENNFNSITLDDIIATYTVKFDKNGATSISNDKTQCISFDKETCEIIAADITTDGIVIGWHTNKDATDAEVKAGETIKITNDKTYYAITKKEYTATFDDTNLDYLEHKELTCAAYNKATSCEIILPEYNKIGHFNNFWGISNEVRSNMQGTKRDLKQFNPVGYPYNLTEDITFYPNVNHFSYSTIDANYTKFRNININQIIKVGKTTFEFEEGIPQEIINKFVEEMTKAYNYFPFLYNKGKVFVMTESTYSNYSIAYGLCHNMYLSYGGDTFLTIDIKYDTSLQTISVNAALHELAHAWDDYYYYITDKNEKGVYRSDMHRISSEEDFDDFYKQITPKLHVDGNGKVISKTETFAGMFTNYYWHVLKIDDTHQYYALKKQEKLNNDELEILKKLMEKYMDFANNNYE